MGYDFIDDINADIPLGYEELQGTLRNSQREFTAKSYLVPAMNRPNLHVTGVYIDEKSGRATGVKFVYSGKLELQVKAHQENILSARAINSC